MLYDCPPVKIQCGNKTLSKEGKPVTGTNPAHTCDKLLQSLVQEVLHVLKCSKFYAPVFMLPTSSIFLWLPNNLMKELAKQSVVVYHSRVAALA